jgi:hypothetical protein
MDKTEFRKMLFDMLKETADYLEIDGTIVDSVQRYGITPLTEESLNEWKELINYVGIEIKF